MTVSFANANQACLSAFGQAFTLTRYEYTDEGIPIADTGTAITGILESGVEPEQQAPGNDSTYARLWVQSSDLVTVPNKGDEISTATTIYTIEQIEQDVAGGMWLLLRKARAVT